MCFPIAALLPALGLIAAGTGAQAIGQSQAERAKRRAFEAEQTRQKGLTDQQQASFQDSLDRTKGLTDQGSQDAATAARESVLSAAIAPPQEGGGSYLPGSASAPKIVADAGAKASANSSAVSSQLAHAIATLGGAQDLKQGIDINIGRNGQAIGQIAGSKAASAGVLDSELTAASHKGDFLTGLGSFAQQLGLAAGSAGLFSGGGGVTSILPKGLYTGTPISGSAFGLPSGLGGIY